MSSNTLFNRLGLRGELVQEIVAAALALALGFGLMPLLIYLAGSSALGKYEGASATALYGNLFKGFKDGSTASWIVLLGPYGLYLLFKGLRLWWRASARLA